ncbi:MAG: curli assembly protein CsgF [Bacteroidales bacterium]|nr:curli assembly protein CsgF [Bacteroidales bacterium]
MKKLLISAILFIAFFQVGALAQDFVYQPINPAFGGNPYNYSWMLAQAQAQNMFVEEDAYAYGEEDPLANLQDDINRQVLNSITQEFYRNQFGEDGLTEGYYKFGSYEIDISPISEGMQVRIIDIFTGSETTIIIPYY